MVLQWCCPDSSCRAPQVWTIGASRYTDNKHSVGDIVAGWLLGMFFAAVALWNCLVLQQRIAARYAADDSAELASQPASLVSGKMGSGRTGAARVMDAKDVVVVPATGAMGEVPRELHVAGMV